MQIDFLCVPIFEQKVIVGFLQDKICFVSTLNENENSIKKYFKNRNAKIVQSSKNPKFYTELFQNIILGKKTIDWNELKLDGTEFQLKVWHELWKFNNLNCLMYYSDFAKHINHPKATRAVAHVIGLNPILILIPCHRVVSKNETVSYRNNDIFMKKWLQNKENILSLN
ncbi:methylated-DNA--[protein]-cysteine S-methyltransferase [Spiroplasma endosymbiont of Labia minor]|uniref:methylated-DNA--[protein]-cysteine S-methyltransferase n=1 Tax=Spiroplasma endosymbiont of Labia minor TaxID=3066305 RepID=UPI0030CE3169